MLSSIKNKSFNGFGMLPVMIIFMGIFQLSGPRRSYVPNTAHGSLLHTRGGFKVACKLLACTYLVITIYSPRRKTTNS